MLDHEDRRRETRRPRGGLYRQSRRLAAIIGYYRTNEDDYDLRKLRYKVYSALARSIDTLNVYIGDIGSHYRRIFLLRVPARVMKSTITAESTDPFSGASWSACAPVYQQREGKEQKPPGLRVVCNSQEFV